MTLKLYYDLTVYAVTVENDGNGSATAVPGSATMGETISLTATPDSGYHFKSWEVVSGDVTISEDKFTMPAGNVTVKALFERKSNTKADALPPITVTWLFSIILSDIIYNSPFLWLVF